jgi:type IV pilus assembly protein PilA
MTLFSKTINRMQRNKEKGFTLIELMIVVAILGILAAIAIPNFMRFQAKSRQSEAKTNLGAIGTTAESYRAENDSYALRPDGVTLVDFNDLGWAPQGTARYAYGYNTAILDTTAAGTFDPEVNAVAATASTFLAAAEGNIDTEAVGEDCWTYNEVRVLANTNNDVSLDVAC